jgi:hypothetical protein
VLFCPVRILSRSSPSLSLRYPFPVPGGFESALITVSEQTLVDNKKTVDLDGRTYPIRQTAKSKRKQIDFRFEDHELRGSEQNPNTRSRWARLAREGKKAMQFLEKGKYIAVIVDGKVHLYK